MTKTATAEPASSATLTKIIGEVKKKNDPQCVNFIPLGVVEKIRKEVEAAGKPLGIAFVKRSISSTVYFGICVNDPTQIQGIDAPQLFFAMKPDEYVKLH